MTEEAADDAPKEGTEESPAAARVKRFREAIDTIRTRADTSAKATAALGTAGLSAIGLAKFADVFPMQPTLVNVLFGVVAVGGFIALGLSLAWFTARLWRVDQPVSMPTTDDEVREQLTEKPLADSTIARYERVAAQNGAPTLRAYEARGQRLARVAERMASTDPRRPALIKTAKAIEEEVEAVKAEAAADTVRIRAKEVVTGPGTRWATLAFVVGLAAIAVGSDHLDSERTGKVSVAKECAAAGKALGEQTVAERDLPPICSELEPGGGVPEDEQAIAAANDCAASVKALTDAKLDTSTLTGAGGACPAAPEPEEEDEATPEQVAAQVIADLLDRAKACEAAGAAKGQSTAGCAPLYELIDRARASL